MQPGPYTRILLTVEPNRFILQPFDGPLHTDGLLDSSKGNANPEQLLQILFKFQSNETEAEKAEQKLKEDKPSITASAPISLLGHVEGQQHRISLVTPGIANSPASLTDSLRHSFPHRRLLD